MSDLSFKVSVQGPGVAIEREISQATLGRLLGVLLLPDAAGGLTPPLGRPESLQNANVAAGEFLSDLNVRTNPERIAGIALYVRDVLGKQTVARDEIPAWFQRAGEAAPKNLVRDVKSAITQRLIAEDHGRAGEYLVTVTGERALRGGGDRESASRPRRKASSSTSRRPSNGKSREKKGSQNADGPTAKVQELIQEDWFATPRTVAQLVAELAARGSHYKDTDLTDQMQQFVRAKTLRRNRQTPDGGNREVWHYSNW